MEEEGGRAQGATLGGTPLAEVEGIRESLPLPTGRQEAVEEEEAEEEEEWEEEEEEDFGKGVASLTGSVSVRMTRIVLM